MTGKMIVPIYGYGFAVYCIHTHGFETVLGQQVWENSEQLKHSFWLEQERYPTKWRDALGEQLVMMAREAGF